MNETFDVSDYPVRRLGRVLLAVWSLFLVSGFAVAISLEPDNVRGYGTHERLGLPPCTFQSMFNIPCPSCGMTTSFSNFVRGNFLAAARANSAGLMLAIICTLQVFWCWVSIVRRRLWLIPQPDVALMWLLGIVCGASVLQWAFRLIWP
ncbi:MAG: DUF2752 domain-containing protein [Planctomycetaceae bacterium]|jgi:hypothetical protein|nr:DUF2752 domain-containing protein [Planctomycetaceae bacterium]MBT6156115.1 DUF2752 domain-containing protein [Planctomycetaceae bacterium]MBT6485151.1 DUF2752 domain-containing protein [Planctomycetaceae bacterium]MBT6497571.1 DUF2752 domain-containing protein [Planctomycetaceae bacterium]